MSSLLPGNHFAELIEPLAGQHAELAGKFALAYEQRTANLIALADLTMHGGLNPDYDMEPIYRRLGLGDK